MPPTLQSPEPLMAGQQGTDTMLNDIIDQSGAIVGNTGSAPTAPFTVDAMKGANRGEVSAQWAMRPRDQKFDTLGDLYNFKKGVWDRSFDTRLRSNVIDVFGPDIAAIQRADFDSPEAHRAACQAAMRQMKVGFTHADGSDVQQVAEVAPTHWAFGQLAQLAGAPAAYMRKIPSQLASECMAYGLRYERQVEDIKLFSNSDELMAAQGPNYGRIPDHEVVEALMRIAGQGKGQDPQFHWKAPGRLSGDFKSYDPEAIGPAEDRTFYGSDRDMFVFLVDDRRPIVVGKTRDGNDDHMFRGFYVQNSMVGSRALKLCSFYLRGVCMNRNLWGVEGFTELSIRHTSQAPGRWLSEIVPALESYAAASDTKLIEGVERAKAKVLATKEDEAIAFLQRRQFNNRVAKAIYDQHEIEEGKPMRSVWDFAQGITAFARNRPNTDDRLDDELKAKALLDTVA